MILISTWLRFPRYETINLRKTPDLIGSEKGSVEIIKDLLRLKSLNSGSLIRLIFPPFFISPGAISDSAGIRHLESKGPFEFSIVVPKRRQPFTYVNYIEFVIVDDNYIDVRVIGFLLSLSLSTPSQSTPWLE